ncbi:MAG: winged helix-turn-helix domain-containing protein [Candidatus Aenigmatarchaeota archaeon]
MDFIRKREELQENSITNEEIQKQAVFLGATLEALRDIKERIERIYLKIAELERKIDERMPERVLSEATFQKEIVSTEEVVEKIASKVKCIARPIIASKEELGIVETKKIQKIISILSEYGKISSSELAEILNLSRTRANEYLKKMEELGIVEGKEIGREKYYSLKE